MQTATAMPAQTPAPAAVPQREPRLLAAGRGASWWGEGWRVFTASPGLWIGILIVFMILIFVMAIIPILGQLALMLLWPAFVGGVLVGCHALARGEPLRFGHLFAGFQDGRFGPLVVLALLYALFGILLSIVLGAVLVALIGASGLAPFLSGDPTQIGLALLTGIGVGLLVVMPLALILGAMIGMAFWFAPALVALNREAPFAAVKKSLRGAWNNIGALMIYGLIYIGLAIVASIPFGLGWLVLGPVFVGSMYASWREVFGE
jgi:uncharacterized membrane protein